MAAPRPVSLKSLGSPFCPLWRGDATKEGQHSPPHPAMTPHMRTQPGWGKNAEKLGLLTLAQPQDHYVALDWS